MLRGRSPGAGPGRRRAAGLRDAKSGREGALRALDRDADLGARGHPLGGRGRAWQRRRRRGRAERAARAVPVRRARGEGRDPGGAGGRHGTDRGDADPDGDAGPRRAPGPRPFRDGRRRGPGRPSRGRPRARRREHAADAADAPPRVEGRDAAARRRERRSPRRSRRGDALLVDDGRRVRGAVTRRADGGGRPGAPEGGPPPRRDRPLRGASFPSLAGRVYAQFPLTGTRVGYATTVDRSMPPPAWSRRRRPLFRRRLRPSRRLRSSPRSRRRTAGEDLELAGVWDTGRGMVVRNGARVGRELCRHARAGHQPAPGVLLAARGDDDERDPHGARDLLRRGARPSSETAGSWAALRRRSTCAATRPRRPTRTSLASRRPARVLTTLHCRVIFGCDGPHERSRPDRGDPRPAREGRGLPGLPAGSGGRRGRGRAAGRVAAAGSCPRATTARRSSGTGWRSPR